MVGTGDDLQVTTEGSPAWSTRTRHSRVNVHGDHGERGRTRWRCLNRGSTRTAFSLVLRDLEVGEYKVVVTAVTDDAGNELRGSRGPVHLREVLHAPAVRGRRDAGLEPDLAPGHAAGARHRRACWPTTRTSPLCSAYQQGDWVTAIRAGGRRVARAPGPSIDRRLRLLGPRQDVRDHRNDAGGDRPGRPRCRRCR